MKTETINQILLNHSGHLEQKKEASFDQDPQASTGGDFTSYLKDQIQNVNTANTTADKVAVDLATGKSENIHETMLALSKAELSFNLMVQVRNKALESYQEVMRMQV